VLVAVALATLARAAAYVGLHSAQKTAAKNASLASVYVLKAIVPADDSAGSAYAQGLIKVVRLPSQFVPTGAVTNLSTIRAHVAWYELPADEVVTQAMFVSPGALHSIAAERIPKGDVAVSVSVDQVHGVAGLIQPGDRVDILANKGGNQETFLYQSVAVLAVGTTLVSSPGNATPGSTRAADQAKNIITFAVNNADATEIAQANSGGGGVTGGIYLALSAAGTPRVPATAITVSNLVPGLNIPASPPGAAQRVAPKSGDQIVRTP
jgi:pilus assembly protein CpaB